MTADRLTPLTDEDLARMKAELLTEFPDHADYADKDGHVYTCETCDACRTCPLSMDPYNTSGDCLAEK